MSSDLRWAETGQLKPIHHPLFSAFCEWFRRQNANGAELKDHPMWWSAFLAGSHAQRDRCEQPEPVCEMAKSCPGRVEPNSPDPVLSPLSDLDLLKIACDGEEAPDREDACRQIAERMAAGKCDPKVGLLVGGIMRIKQEAPQVARRAKIEGSIKAYNLEFTPWW